MQPLLNACCPTLAKIYFKQNFTTSNKHCQVIKHAHYQGIPRRGEGGGGLPYENIWYAGRLTSG